MSAVVREREASGATFAAVVIMISGSSGILEGHSPVAKRTYCMAGWFRWWSCDPLRPPISHDNQAVRGSHSRPGALVNALDISGWRTDDHEYREQ